MCSSFALLVAVSGSSGMTCYILNALGRALTNKPKYFTLIDFVFIWKTVPLRYRNIVYHFKGTIII